MSSATLADLAVALTRDLVRIPSVTPDASKALDHLQALLEPVGFQCERLSFDADGTPSVDNLYARFGSGSPHIAFAGHVDVVPTGDISQWNHDPFGGTIDGDFLYGRGATDMKSGVAAFTSAVINAAQSGFQGSLSLIITGDEEGPAINGTIKMVEWMQANGQIPDLCIVGEPSAIDGIGDNIKVGRRGSLHGVLTVEGIRGHSAYPHRALNPIPILAQCIDAFLKEPIDLGDAVFEPTNLQFVDVRTPNDASNVIPERAEAQFNIRFNALQTPESLEACLNGWLSQVALPEGASASLGFEPCNAEVFVTRDDALVSLVQHACENILGRIPNATTNGGTSDGRFIKDICPVIELGLSGKTMHAIDERVSIEEIRLLAATYAEIIRLAVDES